MIKNIIIIAIAFFIGYNFNAIKDYMIKDFKHLNHVQYCNDYYQGRMELCPYYETDIKNQ